MGPSGAVRVEKVSPVSRWAPNRVLEKKREGRHWCGNYKSITCPELRHLREPRGTGWLGAWGTATSLAGGCVSGVAWSQEVPLGRTVGPPVVPAPRRCPSGQGCLRFQGAHPDLRPLWLVLLHPLSWSSEGPSMQSGPEDGEVTPCCPRGSGAKH